MNALSRPSKGSSTKRPNKLRSKGQLKPLWCATAPQRAERAKLRGRDVGSAYGRSAGSQTGTAGVTGRRDLQRVWPRLASEGGLHGEQVPRSSRQTGSAFEDGPELGIGSRVVPPVMDLPFADPDDDSEFAPLSQLPAQDEYASELRIDTDMETSIQELEARLDGLIRQASEYEPDADEDSSPASAAAYFSSNDEPPRAPIFSGEQDDAGAVEVTRELLSSEYYRRQWGRLGLRRRAEHIDDFGHNPIYERKLRPLLNFLFQRYFRCETRGIENIPREGRCLIVANHSGTFPLDGLMLRAAMRLRHPHRRSLRWLAEDFIFYLPFIGVLMNRLGAVRACQENAQRLLMSESLLAAFPEGTKGVKKLYRERYQLQRFGRGGYIRLCLKTSTPLVPCAIVGSEETNPLIMRLEQLPSLWGWPYFPITPTFPWLGPAGLLPAPTKWKMVFGERVDFDQYGPADADDHLLVARLSEQVQSQIRDMLDRTLKERKGVWLG